LKSSGSAIGYGPFISLNSQSLTKGHLVTDGNRPATRGGRDEQQQIGTRRATRNRIQRTGFRVDCSGIQLGWHRPRYVHDGARHRR